MDRVTYIIDESKLSGLVKRMLTGALKRIGIIALSVFVLQYLSYGRGEFGLLVFSFGITTSFLILMVMFSVKRRLIKTYKSFKLVLDNEGVEVKAEMIPYRSISWQYLEIKEQSNGIIDLYDNRISSFSRRWNGKGWIRIQPEIEDRDLLLSELAKRGALVV
ncbi:hypothetical protein ACEN9X_15055 [Mucilaginibacter sp. Mucisp86]|uniref:hypothetical protein n=1 Tax=Mucilaginibacter sp. Mucisp86 TaxID=3243060 RepID=UPI0039B3F451